MAGSTRTIQVMPGKSIVEMLWDDLMAIVSVPGDLGKRKAGKAEGIAWAIARMLNPLTDPAVTIEIVRECVANYLEALEAGEDTALTVPWRDKRIVPFAPKRLQGLNEGNQQ